LQIDFGDLAGFLIDQPEAFFAVFFDKLEPVSADKAVAPRLNEFAVRVVDQYAGHGLGENHYTAVLEHRHAVGTAVVASRGGVGDFGPIFVPLILEVACADLHEP